jgi:hypothetical protein
MKKLFATLVVVLAGVPSTALAHHSDVQGARLTQNRHCDFDEDEGFITLAGAAAVYGPTDVFSRLEVVYRFFNDDFPLGDGFVVTKVQREVEYADSEAEGMQLFSQFHSNYGIHDNNGDYRLRLVAKWHYRDGRVLTHRNLVAEYSHARGCYPRQAA